MRGCKNCVCVSFNIEVDYMIFFFYPSIDLLMLCSVFVQKLNGGYNNGMNIQYMHIKCIPECRVCHVIFCLEE